MPAQSVAMQHHRGDAQGTRLLPSELGSTSLIPKGAHETEMNREMQIYNRLENTHIITSSIWMRICGRSGSKTKARLSGGPSACPQGPLPALLSVGLTFPVFANPHLWTSSSNPTASGKPSYPPSHSSLPVFSGYLCFKP